MKVVKILAAMVANLALGMALGLVVRAHDTGMPDDSKWVTGCNLLPGWDRCADGAPFHVAVGLLSTDGHTYVTWGTEDAAVNVFGDYVPQGVEVKLGHRCYGVESTKIYFVEGC